MVLYRFVSKTARINKRQIFIENKHYIDAYIDKTQSHEMINNIARMMEKHKTKQQVFQYNKLVIKKHLDDMMISNQDYVNNADYQLMDKIMDLVNSKPSFNDKIKK